MFNNFFLYCITILIWGSTWLAIKFQLGSVDPMISVFYRFALATFLLGCFCFIQRKRMSFSIICHVFMAIQGICLFSFNYWLIYMSEVTLTSGLVAVIFSTIVFFNIFNSYIFLKFPAGLRVISGAALGVAGVGLVFWPEIAGFNTGLSGLQGILLATGGTALASFGNTISARNQRDGIPVIQNNLFSMAYGSVFMAVFAIMSGRSVTIDLSFSYLSSLIYLSLFGSVLAFGCYLTLIGRIGSVKASYANLLFPVVALAISTVVEGYQWSWLSLIGVAIIVSGNFIALTPVSYRHILQWAAVFFKRINAGISAG